MEGRNEKEGKWVVRVKWSSRRNIKRKLEGERNERNKNYYVQEI